MDSGTGNVTMSLYTLGASFDEVLTITCVLSHWFLGVKKGHVFSLSWYRSPALPAKFWFILHCCRWWFETVNVGNQMTVPIKAILLLKSKERIYIEDKPLHNCVLDWRTYWSNRIIQGGKRTSIRRFHRYIMPCRSFNHLVPVVPFHTLWS